MDFNQLQAAQEAKDAADDLREHERLVVALLNERDDALALLRAALGDELIDSDKRRRSAIHGLALIHAEALGVPAPVRRVWVDRLLKVYDQAEQLVPGRWPSDERCAAMPNPDAE